MSRSCRGAKRGRGLTTAGDAGFNLTREITQVGVSTVHAAVPVQVPYLSMPLILPSSAAMAAATASGEYLETMSWREAFPLAAASPGFV